MSTGGFGQDQADVTVIFHHDPEGDLAIKTGMNEISWGYNLNTASYPTYGGQVIQILSCYIDDFEISGDVHSYAELENIYRFFLSIVQKSTQGPGGPTQYQAETVGSDGLAYDQQPVEFSYPTRGWHFKLIPKTLPEFHYGRDVVVPTWRMTAAVAQSDRIFEDIIVHTAQKTLAGMELDSNLDQAAWALAASSFQSRVTADIGYDPNNKYQGPQSKFDNASLPPNVKGIVDFFNNTVLDSYLNNNGDIATLRADYSGPAFGTTGNNTGGQGTPNPKGKKK